MSFQAVLHGLGIGTRALYDRYHPVLAQVIASSQQRGYPGIPIVDYTRSDLEREFHTAKPCAPLCTIGCVHRASSVDRFRAKHETR